MDESRLHRPDYLRYLHETILSLNVALVVIWVKSATTAYWRLEARVASFFASGYPGSDNYAAGFPAFFVLTILLTCCFLFLLRVFARTRFIEEFLNSIAGVLALLAAPAGWFYVDGTIGELNKAWFPVEGGIVLIFCLYLYRKQLLPMWGGLLIILLHYTFWFWIIRQHFPGNPLGSVFPMVGLCSGVVWIVSVDRRPV